MISDVVVVLVIIYFSGVWLQSDIETSNKEICFEKVVLPTDIDRETTFVENATFIKPSHCVKETDGELCIVQFEKDQGGIVSEKYRPIYDKDADKNKEGNYNQETNKEDKTDKKTTGCSSSPCKNGGTCIDTPIGPKCTCLNGMEGQLCEYDNAEEKVNNISDKLGIFNDELKEDVKNVSRKIAQKFDNKNPEMKIYLRKLLPKVLSSLTFPGKKNKIEDILSDILSYFTKDEQEYIENTLYKFLKIFFEDQNETEREYSLRIILEIMERPIIEWEDLIMLLLERIFHCLSQRQ